MKTLSKRGRKSFLPTRIVKDLVNDLEGKYECEGVKFHKLNDCKEYFGKSKFVRISNKPKNKKIPKKEAVIVDNDSYDWIEGKKVLVFGVEYVCRKVNGQFRYIKN
jgi:hypothetical protein